MQQLNWNRYLIAFLAGFILLALTDCNKRNLRHKYAKFEGDWEWVLSVRPSTVSGVSPNNGSTTYTYYNNHTPQNLGETHNVTLRKNGRATTYKDGAEEHSLKISLYFDDEQENQGQIHFSGSLYRSDLRLPFNGFFKENSNDTLYVKDWPFDDPYVEYSVLVRK